MRIESEVGSLATEPKQAKISMSGTESSVATSRPAFGICCGATPRARIAEGCSRGGCLNCSLQPCYQPTFRYCTGRDPWLNLPRAISGPSNRSFQVWLCHRRAYHLQHGEIYLPPQRGQKFRPISTIYLHSLAPPGFLSPNSRFHSVPKPLNHAVFATTAYSTSYRVWNRGC